MSVPRLSIQDLTLPNFPGLVSESEKNQSQSLLIGNGFLEHFIVTIDWTNQQLYLQPVSPQRDLYPQEPIYKFQAIAHNHHLLITGLYSPSPAAQAGLQIGDRILTINDDSYTYLDDEQSCSLIHSPVGDRYPESMTMTVERDGKLLTYTLHPQITAPDS